MDNTIVSFILENRFKQFPIFLKESKKQTKQSL